MKKTITIFVAIVLWATGLTAQNKITDQPVEKKFNFIIGTDLGRNGRYDQAQIAELMGETAGWIDAEFIISSGDTHHYMGVQSTEDPLWMTNYELVYSHPQLQIPWYPLLGNHEYRGNTQAILDYSQKSRRWQMPDRYYSQTYAIGKNDSLCIVYIDTPPLIDKYRNDNRTYPDAVKQDMEKQLAWINNTLKNSKAKWKIVVGHHPIYAFTPKDKSERTDLQTRLDPILKANKVDLYVCGHLHNFQHLKWENSSIDYIVNSSGAQSRKASPLDETVFCNSETGFSVVSVNSNELILYMVNNTGEVVHKVVRAQ